MATSNPNRTPMYPKVITSDPPFFSKKTPQTPSLYPKIDISDNLVHTLFPDNPNPSAPPEDPSLSLSSETLITVPGAILHLIDRTASVELACGDLSIVRLRQGVNDVAVFAHVAEEVQWPLAKDEASVRLDEGHYFFSFPAPREEGERESGGDDEVLNLGLTIATKGQDGNLLKELDKILEHYSSFTVQKVSEKVDGTVVREVSPADLKSEKKKAMMEDKCRAYWTTLAPNVEDYSGTAAKLIASGSGQLIKGILWCGDVTVDRLKWGNEVLRKSMKPGSKSEVSPDTLKRLKRVKRVTKMTEKVATGLLSGVVKVSGFFTSSVANSKAGKKFFSLLPGEIILASLDGFNKICDAVEVAGKNVMSTSSTVTTGLVSQRYGEEAGKATNEGLDAAGHAIGTAWAVFKIRKALNPKSALKPTTIAKTAAKTAAVEMKKAKSSK